MAGGVEFCPFLGATTQCIQSDCELWAGTECGINVLRTEMVKYASHIHDSHFHQEAHVVGTIPGSGGAAQGVSTTLPLASNLTQEFFNNESRTNGGEVYGYDYQVDPDDEDIPITLANLSNMDAWPDAEDKRSWADVVATKG